MQFITSNKFRVTDYYLDQHDGHHIIIDTPDNFNHIGTVILDPIAFHALKEYFVFLDKTGKGTTSGG